MNDQNMPENIATQVVRDAIGALPMVVELGNLFAQAGFDIALVGGSVRDLILQRDSVDLDFTTPAKPEDIVKITTKWADAVWDLGRA
jgi:poly(A) polymerase